MTRINLVDPKTLCDQHLLAEHRELTRIPNTIKSGKAKVDPKKIPCSYTLGKGHVTFFYDKLYFLYNRYEKLHKECLVRGFNVEWKFPELDELPENLLGDYFPSEISISTNVERILERASEMKVIRLLKDEISLSDYDALLHGRHHNVFI
jgi:hypothetical protein